jgi:hypothetical protein
MLWCLVRDHLCFCENSEYIKRVHPAANVCVCEVGLRRPRTRKAILLNALFEMSGWSPTTQPELLSQNPKP